MSEYTKEEAYDLYDKITEMLEDKPMLMVLEVMANIMRNMCDSVTKNQKAAIVMTILDALGLQEEEGTLQ